MHRGSSHGPRWLAICASGGHINQRRRSEEPMWAISAADTATRDSAAIGGCMTELRDVWPSIVQPSAQRDFRTVDC